MNRRTAGFVIAGLILALGLAFGVSRYATSQPDGLTKVAQDQGLDRDEQPHALAEGPLADYRTDGVADPAISTGLAGAVGVGVTFAIAGGVIFLSSRLRRGRQPEPVTGP